jgi:AraC-like DNA-binding protein
MLKTAFSLLPMFVSLFWMAMLIVDTNRNKFIRNILVAFFGVTFLLYFSHALYFNYEYDIYRYFDPVYSFATLAVYPLFFFYIFGLTREVKFRPVNYLLLLPAVLIGGAASILYNRMGAEESDIFIRQVLYRSVNHVSLSETGNLQLLRFRLVPVVFTIQLILILISGSRMIIQFDEKVKNFYADTEGKELHQIKKMLYTFGFFSVFSIIANVMGRAYFLSEELLVIPSVIFSVLLFVLGNLSYNQRFSAIDLRTDDNAPSYEEEMYDEHEPDFVYSKAQQVDLQRKLQLLLDEEKIYIQQDLRIVDLSVKLHTNRTYVSRLINQVYGKSFSDLINQYRFQEAKMMLTAPGYSLLSIAEIANRAGFPSESSFYRVFKKETGMAPGDWRKLNGRIKA